MRLLSILTLALAGMMLFGVGTASADNTRVRVLHASPDAPAVDVYANGARVLSNVAFRGISDYLSVPSGRYTFEVRPAGAAASSAPVLTATAELQANTDYTVAAINRLSEINARVFVDNNATPASGKAHVRVVHASTDAGNVDVAVRGGPVLVPNLPFGEQAGPLPVDAGTYNLEVRAAGTSTVALPLDGVRLESGRVYTFIANGFARGNPALTVTPAVYTPPPAAAPNLPRAGEGGVADGAAGIPLIAWAAIAGGLAAGGLLVVRRVGVRVSR